MPCPARRSVLPLLLLLTVAAHAHAGGTRPEPDFLTAAYDHIAEREYWASENERGLQAPNRRHRLRTYFRSEGIEVIDRASADTAPLLGLRLVGLGRPSAIAAVAPAEVHHEGARVELRRPGLVEWYENRRDGLEQGFTLARAPEGEGRLVLALGVEGARISRRGEALALRTKAGRSLAYGKLVALDADGRELPSELVAVGEDRIELRVDDRGAAYPVVIDPLLSAIDDTILTGDQVGAQFGSQVDSAGDVNGDGFADVIVGAPFFDAGENNEGAAFIFLGGPGGVADAGTTSAQAQLETDAAFAGLNDVAGAGDLNGDGYSDVVIGSGAYPVGGSASGAAFVFLGGPLGIADGNPSTADAVLESDQAVSLFGQSVDSAGDVNADGFGDLIVGASNYDGPGIVEGAAFVFLGSAAGIADGGPLTADAVLRSDQDFSDFGRSVATAGDVNGDGFADVIVGATDYDNGEIDEGAAFVFHGSASGIASGGPAQAATTLESNITGCNLGTRVTSAGDINGDGFADVVIAGDTCQPTNLIEGVVFVFLGGPAGVPSGGSADAHVQLVTQLGGTISIGSDVAALGDVNGDGYADVAVGVSRGGAMQEGFVFVFIGSAAGIPDGRYFSAYARLESNQNLVRLGAAVAGAGDVNGDGYDDLIAGAPNYDIQPMGSPGAAFVYHGSADGLLDASAAQAAARLESNQASSEFGYAVASAGDVNGDGLGDVIVGARGYDAGQVDEGAAFVFLGTPAGIADAIPTTAHAQLESNQAGGGLGSAVATAGDVNGDGFDDVIVGTDGYDNGEIDEGVAFVFHGSAAGIADGDPTTADATIEMNQAMAADGNGTTVASAGDVNGDGFADVLVGASYYDYTQTNEGIVLLFHGGAAGVGDGSLAEAEDFFVPSEFNARLGAAIAPVGDVNGDGFSDFALGATLWSSSVATDGGAVALLLGGELALGTGDVLNGDDPFSSFGGSVAAAGDVNGDGYADVIVGAPFYDSGSGNAGAAFIFHGHGGGFVSLTVADADTTLTAGQLDARFGNSVASAGDVNGDGFADVIVGANFYDNGETNEGAAFVFLGSATGVASTTAANAAALLESDQADAEFGRSVAGIGDADRDGFADVLVGAPGYDSGQSDEGAAFVFTAGLGEGRPAQPRQTQTLGGASIPVGGVTTSGGFDVSLEASHPAGGGLAKLEVEWCPPGAPFDDASCGRQVAAAWTDVSAGASGTTLVEPVSGLAPDTLYRWRARVLRAPLGADAIGIVQAPNPPHGPWRRPLAQSREGDVRAVPEPGLLGALAVGVLALVARWPRHRARFARAHGRAAALAHAARRGPVSALRRATIRRSLLPLLALLSLVTPAAAQLAGTYSIDAGGAGDYTTIQAAANDLLAQGVAGPVTFEIAAGTWIESGGTGRVLDIASEVTGASETNRITFTAAPGLAAEDVVLERSLAASFAIDHNVVDLRASWITLRGLSFRGVFTGAGNQGTLVRFGTNGAATRSLVIEDCIFTTTATSMIYGIAYSSSNGWTTDATIRNNRFDGFLYAIQLVGGAQHYDFVIEGNTIERPDADFLGGGRSIWVQPGIRGVIRGNRLDFSNGKGNTAIYAAQVDDLLIEANQVLNVTQSPRPQAPYYQPVNGIWINGGSATIVDNMLSAAVSYGFVAIRVTGGAAFAPSRVLHNSARNIGAAAYGIARWPLVQVSGAPTPTPELASHAIRNNVFSLEASSALLRLVQLAPGSGSSGGPLPYDMGSNLLYNENGAVVYLENAGTTVDTLEDWQALGEGVGSTARRPEFVAAHDLHLAGCGLVEPDLIGIPLSEPAVADDFDGEVREPLIARMGADQAASTSSGLFSPAEIYPLGGVVFDVAEGDFDGDGDPDLAATWDDPLGQGFVEILSNQGDGTFVSVASLSPVASSEGPFYVRAGDVDGDGNVDLVTTESFGIGLVYVHLYWGNGDNTFVGPVAAQVPGALPGTTVAYPTSVSDVEMADLDGDSDLDLVVSSLALPAGSNFVAVLCNEGNRVFQEVVAGPASTLPFATNDVILSDLDQDGDVDSIVGSVLGGPQTVHHNATGPGTCVLFDDTEAITSTGGDASSLAGNLAAAPLDADAFPDLVYDGDSVTNPDEIFVQLGDGDRTFAPATPIALQTSPTRHPTTLTPLDHDGDGDIDLFVGNEPFAPEGQGFLLVNDGQGSFAERAACSQIGLPQPLRKLISADVDDDGRDDVIGPFATGSGVAVLRSSAGASSGQLVEGLAAVYANGVTDLDWSTPNEVQNAGFAVERREDASLPFERIGTVTGVGTSTTPQAYAFTDSDPPLYTPTQFVDYRLVQWNFDGATQTTAPVSIFLPEPGVAGAIQLGALGLLALARRRRRVALLRDERASLARPRARLRQKPRRSSG